MASDYINSVLNGTYNKSYKQTSTSTTTSNKKKKKYESDYINQVLDGTYKSNLSEFEKMSVTTKVAPTTSTPKKDLSNKLVPSFNNNTYGLSEENLQKLNVRAVPSVEETVTRAKDLKKDEDKAWYKEFFKSSAAFKDGYDFGDVTKTVVGSAADATLSTARGILGAVEGITDFATYAVGEGLDLIGADNAAEKVKEAGKYSWVDGMLDRPQNYHNANSIFGDTSDSVFQGIGTTLGFMAGGGLVKLGGKAVGAGANAIGKAGNAISATGKAAKTAKAVSATANVTGKVAKVMQTGNVALNIGKHSLKVPIAVVISGSGSGMSEAYSKGNVEDWQAWTSGVGSGVIEGVTEGMFGMFGIGGSSLDDALTGRAMSAAKTGFGKAMAKVGVQATGEGVEEMVSYVANYGLNHGIDLVSQITGDTDVKLGEQFSSEDFWENFFVGAASAALMGGASTSIDIGNAQDNAIKAAETELGRKLTAEEKKSIKKQTSLQLMEETEAEMLNKKSETEQKLVDNYVNAKTTELTKEKAIESELEKAIKTREAEQGGVLSDRNKEALKKSIMAKIESGEIDISGTKIDKKDLKKIQAEVERSLEDGKYDLAELEDVLTPEKTAQLNELQEQLNKTKSETKKAELQDQINNLLASKAADLQGMLSSNKYLNKAVYESVQSKKKYEYDESQVKTKGNFAKSVYESASTHANNATEIRNFVENVARLAEDRQTSYRFTNNAELKEQGDLLEKEKDKLKPHEQAKLKELEAKLSKARTEADKKKIQDQIDEIKYYDIGGFVRKNVDGVETVLLNVDSKQSMSAVVGHETKHLLEKNGLNKDFNKLLFEYAKSKGDYDTYKERIEKLYDGKGDVESELAAALTGDYLFTDSKFIETLLNNENKTLGQKIKELIDDLIIKFKGTDQEKQLREVQKKFKELYKQQATQAVSATQETNTQYSILDGNKEIQIYNAVRIDEKNASLDAEAKPHGLYLSNLYETDFNEFESPFAEDYEDGERHNFKVEPKNPLIVKTITLDNAKYKYRAGGMMATLDADASLSALKELVGEQEFTKVSEMSKKELIDYLNNKFSEYDFSNYYDKAELLMAYGSVEARNRGYDAIITERSTDPFTADIDNEIVVLKNDILKTEVETKYSLTDNQGRTLTKEQQEFFKDSKVRDSQGRLLEVYHGTKAKGINIFNYDPNRQTGTDYGKAYYFTTDYIKAQGYQYDIEKDPLYIEYNKQDEKWKERVFATDNAEERSRLIKEWGNWHKENSVMKILDNENYTPENLPDGETKKIYLNIKNPYIADAKGQYYFKVYDNYFNQARKNGNDGIIVKNVIDNPKGEPRPIDVYIAFNENQIKNVDNTNPTSNPDTRYSLSVDTKGRKLSAQQISRYSNVAPELRDENGNLKVYYHGTKRADRVGTLFDPNKATSGPMAYFTDSQEIADSYSRNKADTSLSREYDTEYELFKVDGKGLDEYWNSLSRSQQAEIAEKANNVGFDDDFENIVYGENASEDSFGDQYKWRLKNEYKGNALKSLYAIWIEDGNLMDEDIAKFKEILELSGIENVSYLDPYKTEEKVYEVYLNIKKPFDTSKISDDIVNQFKEASKTATVGEQYSADMWDKSNITPEQWINKLEDDLENGTAHAWTVIPDWTTDVLKANGYDGIVDTGGKRGGESHQVVIPFYSEQIKDVNNLNPTDDAHIDMSLSDRNQAISPIGDYNIYGSDIKVQEELDESETAEVSEVGNRLEADTTRAREEATRDIRELKAGLNTRVRDTIQNNLGLDNKAVDDIMSKLNSKDTVTEQDVYDAFEGHRQIVEPISDSMLQERSYVKAWLKDMKINLGKAYKSDVNAGEFNDFRRKYFNKTNFVLNGGTNVDTAYMEMSDMFPHLFPEDIVHPADQVIQIASVLDEVYGPKTQTYELTDNDLSSIVNEIYGGYTVINNYRQIFMEKYGEDIFETPQNANTDTLSGEASNLSSDTQNVSKRVKLSEIDTNRNTSPVTDEETAEIMVDEPTTAKQKKDKKWSMFRAAVLDKGSVFEDLSLKIKNRFLMGKWDYMLTSEARAQNVIGQGHYEYDPSTKTSKQVSKSLNDIRAEVANTGHTKEFYEFMYHNLNIDRMTLESRAQAKIKELQATLSSLTAQQMQGTDTTSQANEIKEEIARLREVKNKPVFGSKITAQLSQDRVNEYLEQFPEFENFAKDVYDYARADRQQLVKAGVISQETADLWEEMYPHFIPIRRADKQGVAINVALDTGRTGVNAPIQRATGGNTDILPLFDTMAQRTMQTHRAAAKNSFGVELKNSIDSARVNHITTVDEIIDSVDMQEGLLQEGVNGRNPTFTVFENGERVTYEITQEMYEALKPVSDSSMLSKTSKILNTASSFHRGVLTQYNPVFMLTNAIKDVQDVLINSQHPFSTYKKIPEAFAQLTQKGYWYQEYMANGGEQNSYFDSQDNTFDTERKGISKVLDWFPLKQIADMNDFVEMIPRLSEYIASREAGRSIEVSMLDAARVTTNFKAGGDLTKFLNRNGVTFLNASVQGAMQQVRNVREANANGLKGWAMLATKFAVASVPVAILNGLLWGDDDEYEELSEYVKENYYIVGKYGDGNFIRIPKGRTVAVIQDALNQIVNVSTGDDEADLKGFLELMVTNLAPNNPIENNILSPIVQVATNKTWYGEDLVPSRLQDLPTKEQFDESTDNLSRWLGEKTGISPVKINYLLDQYTGGVGDVVLPMMTPEATSGTDSVVGNVLAPLTKKFTTSSTMNNQNVSDFYSTSEELTTEAKKSGSTDEDVLRNKYINSIKAEMNELYAEKRKIQNSTLSKSEKYKKVQSVQKQINELSKKGLNNYEEVNNYGTYAAIGDREFYRTINSDGEVEWSKVKDKEAGELKQLGLSGTQKNSYFAAKNEISSITKNYTDNKGKLSYIDEDSDDYKEAIEVLSSDKKASIANTIKNTSLNDEQKAYLYKKYYNSDTIDTMLLSGISVNDYLDYASQDIKADVNRYGKTISGSRKTKVENYINGMSGMSYGQKIILFKSEYNADDRYNNDIIDYLNSNDDISYDDMVYILQELGFKVSSSGTISW